MEKIAAALNRADRQQDAALGNVWVARMPPEQVAKRGPVVIGERIEGQGGVRRVFGEPHVAGDGAVFVFLVTEARYSAEREAEWPA